MNRSLGLCVAILGLALVGCAQPQAAPGTPGGGAETPKAGGVLNSYGDDFTDWDVVYQGKTSENSKNHGLVYDTLLRIKRGPGVDFVEITLEPNLAERWEVSSDGRSFTYYLRPGVKWANVAPVNGRQFTSADVKWTIEYYSRTGEYLDKGLPFSQMAALFEGLEGVETPNPSTVRVRFKDPNAPFPNYSASRWMPMAPRETFKADAKPSPRIDTLIGTGPFMLDPADSLRDNRWVFKKNPDYWDAPKPYIESIRRLIIPDLSTRRAAFQARQIDWLPIASADYATVPETQQANPQSVLQEALNPVPNVLFASQLRNGPLRDIRVRRAISLGIDRDEYNNVLSAGKGEWQLSGGWPGLFNDAETKQMLKYDPEEAKRLLAEAGYPNGLRLEDIPSTVNVAAQLRQAQLKKIGIDVYFTVLPREQNRARLYVGDFDFFCCGGTGIGDADFDAFQSSFLSGSGQNWSQIKDPELDKLILAQRQQLDPTKRRENQRAVVKRINEMAWNPGMVTAPTATFWHPYVKNFGAHWTQGPPDAFVWLDK